jgi:hypothetical protein
VPALAAFAGKRCSARSFAVAAEGSGNSLEKIINYIAIATVDYHGHPLPTGRHVFIFIAIDRRGPNGPAGSRLSGRAGVCRPHIQSPTREI